MLILFSDAAFLPQNVTQTDRVIHSKASAVHKRAKAFSFRSSWLLVVCLGVAVFGLALVLVPRLARVGFSLLIFNDAERINAFGAQMVAYVSLVHAVLGAVMFGWSICLHFIVYCIFHRRQRDGWRIVAAVAGYHHMAQPGGS